MSKTITKRGFTTIVHFNPVIGVNEAKKGFKLVNFGYTYGIEFNEAVEKLKALGLRPVGRGELSAFDSCFPKEKYKYPIVALDRCSPLSGMDKDYVAYLEPGSSELLRKLTGWGDYWDNECRFLAVRV